MADRIREQDAERQLAAEGPGHVDRDLPAADGAGHGEGAQRARGGNRIMAEVAIGLDRRPGAGRAAGLDGSGPALCVGDQPEAIAADAVHVRVDNGDRGRHGDHRLDGIAALDQDALARLAGQMMGRRNGGVAKDGRFHRRCHSLIAILSSA